MSLAIRWGSNEEPDNPSGFIYLNSVTSYNQEYTGQVTKHPVDSSANITDHYIKNNPTFSISGVVSGVDLSSIPYDIRDQNGNTVVNATPQPVSIQFDNTVSGLLQYLPDSIGQFLSKSFPSPIADVTNRTDLSSEILVKDLLRNVMDGLKYNPKTDKVESYITLVELYEFDGLNIRDIISDLVITSVRIREDADTGDALYLDMSLEKVQFALLEKTELPQDVQTTLKPKVETKKKKGKVDSTSKDCSDAQASKDPTAPETPEAQISRAKAGGSLVGKVAEGILGG
ncbi:hypothetical protein D3C85_629130 [compost metagenome]